MSYMILLQADTSGLMQMLPFVAMLGVLYFFMIRPQMARQKKEKQFRSEIKKGAKVVTTSGIHGRIAEINDNNNTVVIETGAGKIKFERAAISMELTQKQTEK
ncbi:protein translocase subunit yajC [Tenacibaculum skagerrakense]|uniref:Sec translocon accessory complex subunit YajC n=1 Tax=Tenacibaculum skagerrakense TaxID=186571 RepID=A0A4R2NXC2_9FLAO|nr:preprotein translocase subunit YajC [Tenacibaculum skagerrakense]TCP26833.1 protein translocase subunit yajC [Tenacibaculum skagerrakense]